MKRILSALLLVAMVFAFAACGETNSAKTNGVSEPKITFESVEAMKEAVDGVWMNCKSGDYMIIKDGQLSKLDELTKQNAFNNLKRMGYKYSSFENYYVKFLKECGEEIEYDYKNGCVILKSTNMTFFKMSKNDEAIDENSVVFMRNFITEDKFKEEMEDEYINLKYPDALTNRDVQFDKYGNIDKNFIISGTAELDDYYNYGYKNIEAGYFCIQVTPINGSYTDRWYIYASRSEFSELFNQLKNGSQNVMIIARLTSANTGSDNMATLVECV
ncbi:MAG: hypothetical protein E7580_08825 [Ruminococcaceae bacterium]|nr:hypothetical protein [Oscillospiraceae bacterium]